MVDYTPAEAGMRRMIVIRNHLENLRILFESKIAPSTASYYGILHLAQFTSAYNGLMGRLTPRQKRLVLCVTDLISGVTVHKKTLKEVRDNWMAHLQDNGWFAEDASDSVRRVGMPGYPAAHYEMHVCIIAFVDTVRALLPKIAEPTVEKFNRTGDATPKYYCDGLNRAIQNTRARLEAARKRAEREFPDMQWSSPLGAAGVRMNQLGPAGPGACTARVDGPCEGGAERR